MRRSIRSCAAAVLLASPLPPQNPPTGFQYQTLSDDQLDRACSMAFLPDGRLLLAERVTGQLRLFADGALQATPWATVPSSGTAGSETGLLGIAVDPAFLRSGFVYVFYTTAAPAECVVARLQEVAGRGQNLTVLTPPGSIVAASSHVAGRMVFGQDGMLYVGTGDRQLTATAQNLQSWNGKILRLQPPGLTIPPDNPYPGSAVWSYGHRNQYGLAVDPRTGGLYQTENGSTFADELNRIRRGANYGWPQYEGLEPVPDPATEDPLVELRPVVAPVGTCFHSGEVWPPSQRGRWYVVRYIDGVVEQLTLDAAGDRVVARSVFDDLPGNGYDVQMGPDGNLWVLHNDARGVRGGDELGRWTYAGATPAAQMTALSQRAVGGSVTWGFTGRNGDFVIAWLGATRLHAGGSDWVTVDAMLPGLRIVADDRVYFGAPVVASPQLIGATVHSQAAHVSPALQVTFGRPASIMLR